jgi:multidrug efflux system outer membrane protein
MNIRGFAVTAVAAAALSACAVGPDYQAPANPPVPDQFAGAQFSAFSAEASNAAQFWTVFQDEELSALVSQAYANNRELRLALSRLNEARALRREAFYDYLPTLSANAGYTRSLQSVDQSPGLSRDAREGGLYEGSFDAAWELDLFGRVRRNNEAAQANEDALLASLADAQLSVAAEVARSYFELRGGQERLEVARRNADNQAESLRLTQARRDAGRGTDLDVARATAQLESTRAVLPQLEAGIDNSRHRLAVLTGQLPTALDIQLAPVRALPELPRLTHIGQPDALLRRRADVRVAERQLAAATARIGVATAELFPQVTFQGEIGFAVSDLSDAGSGSGETWAYGPGIRWAIFDLGHVKARIDQSKARADGALASYEQAVLLALEDTENALSTYGRSRRQLDHLAQASAASGQAAQLAQVRFDAGAADFLDVLDAQREQLAAEDALSQARTAAATGLVAVYKAMGGGWSDAGSATVVAGR